MKKNIFISTALSLFLGVGANAQTFGDKDMILLGTQNVSLSCADTVLYVPYLSNGEVIVQSDASWVTAQVKDGAHRLKLNVASNLESDARTAVVQVCNSDKSLVRTLTLVQERENFAQYAPSAKVVISSASASSSQPGEGIERSYDGNTSTLWHSSYGGVQFPVTLTYNFSGVERIDYFRYVPRTSGKNGCFQKVEVFVKSVGETNYRSIGTYDFGGNNSPYELRFPESLLNPASVQFKVLSATTSETNNYASCAEMEFYRDPDENDPNLALFASDAWDELKEGTTQADIDALTNPYSKFVAQQLFDNKEEFTKGRVATYECVLSPDTLSSIWNTPSKYYDHLQGVTGINVSKGISGVAVSGLPEGKKATLKIVAWFSKELVKNDRGEWVGGDPVEYSYTLQNGINSINYPFDYDGLAYIAYFADSQEEEATAPEIKVHFINGQVNGYLSPDRTNEELDLVLRNAKNRCIDLVGEKVHSIWQVSGLLNYCKASDGSSKGYVQYMNVLDTLVGWEHHLLGFDKYNRIPKNRTCAYVNYTYYMFQGYYGVSFKYDTESRVLNCNTIMYNDGDAIWGLSHEWGHQHQMQPYFCWAGLGESSNNMNSCENVLRMGYTGEWHAKRIRENWENAYAHFFEGKTTINKDDYGNDKMSYQYVGPNRGNYAKNGNNYVKVADGSGDYVYELEKVGPGAVATKRNEAYRNINKFSWCPAIQNAIREQFAEGSRIPDKSEKEKTLSTSEVYVEENTAPFYMLHNYFSYILPKEGDSSKKDFQLDLYEALRQTDEPNGSTIEPGKTEVDKYELLASVQNGNKNGKYDEFIAKYPNSCWTKQKYIYTKYVNDQGNEVSIHWTQNSVPFIFNYIRKASRICGYNLFDYFDKFGFLRTVVMTIDDYGNKDYVMMEDMKAEFKEDMEALGLKKIDAAMMEKIAHSDLPKYETPTIPNELP